MLDDRLRAMKFELQGATYESYMKKLQERKGVVEERIMGEEFRSPSVQLRVTPLGKVELLSTHDQLLGGPTGQSYLGCVFPADTAYAPSDHQGSCKGRQTSGQRRCYRSFRFGFCGGAREGRNMGAVRD